MRRDCWCSSSHSPSVSLRKMVEVRARHRPQAAVDLALGCPAASPHTYEIARLVGRGLDDMVDRIGAEREVLVLHERTASVPGEPVAAHQRHQGAARERPAVIHRVGDLLRRFVPGKRLPSERRVGRSRMTPTWPPFCAGAAMSTVWR